LLAADPVLIPAQPSPFDGRPAGEMPKLIDEASIFRRQLVARCVCSPARRGRRSPSTGRWSWSYTSANIIFADVTSFDRLDAVRTWPCLDSDVRLLSLLRVSAASLLLAVAGIARHNIATAADPFTAQLRKPPTTSIPATRTCAGMLVDVSTTDDCADPYDAHDNLLGTRPRRTAGFLLAFWLPTMPGKINLRLGGYLVAG
jgi:hypothetical protein